MISILSDFFSSLARCLGIFRISKIKCIRWRLSAESTLLSFNRIKRNFKRVILPVPDQLSKTRKRALFKIICIFIHYFRFVIFPFVPFIGTVSNQSPDNFNVHLYHRIERKRCMRQKAVNITNNNSKIRATDMAGNEKIRLFFLRSCVLGSNFRKPFSGR